ncbi:MAG: septum formation initiator family protein [Chitinophagaceae bacterium]|jgi:cell division protein FtsB|nr:septum formation initiator family protein [Chitinophagaceae bacterium]
MKAVLIFLKNAIFNRYVLALAAFAVWMAFFDKNDFFTQQARKAELEALNEKIGYYRQQIAATQQELQALQNDPGTLERYAREKYFMKRPNEDIYVLPDSTAALPAAK